MKGENFMKQILYYLVLFILFSCSGDQPQFLWEKMIKHRQANELSESIAILHEIIKEFSYLGVDRVEDCISFNHNEIIYFHCISSTRVF